jgi:hypothetical protein
MTNGGDKFLPAKRLTGQLPEESELSMRWRGEVGPAESRGYFGHRLTKDRVELWKGTFQFVVLVPLGDLLPELLEVSDRWLETPQYPFPALE